MAAKRAQKARDSGMPLAVRSGGHGVAGYGLPDGGLVLDLADMRSLVIDAQARTAWAETGLTAAAYSTAADAHGLATGFGTPVRSASAGSRSAEASVTSCASMA